VRIEEAGGLAAIAIDCLERGAEARLIDVVGFTVGSVVCDGSIEWKE
jgi:hypothetical protein